MGDVCVVNVAVIGNSFCLSPQHIRAPSPALLMRPAVRWTGKDQCLVLFGTVPTTILTTPCRPIELFCEEVMGRLRFNGSGAYLDQARGMLCFTGAEQIGPQVYCCIPESLGR